MSAPLSTDDSGEVILPLSPNADTGEDVRLDRHPTSPDATEREDDVPEQLSLFDEVSTR
jgi:hypothetical protein